jgi:hypothetical protein
MKNLEKSRSRKRPIFASKDGQGFRFEAPGNDYEKAAEKLKERGFVTGRRKVRGNVKIAKTSP